MKEHQQQQQKSLNNKVKKKKIKKMADEQVDQLIANLVNEVNAENMLSLSPSFSLTSITTPIKKHLIYEWRLPLKHSVSDECYSYFITIGIDPLEQDFCAVVRFETVNNICMVINSCDWINFVKLLEKANEDFFKNSLWQAKENCTLNGFINSNGQYSVHGKELYQEEKVLEIYQVDTSKFTHKINLNKFLTSEILNCTSIINHKLYILKNINLSNVYHKIINITAYIILNILPDISGLDNKHIIDIVMVLCNLEKTNEYFCILELLQFYPDKFYNDCNKMLIK